jgi:hypothetical protein
MGKRFPLYFRLFTVTTAWAFQPDPAALRKLYEDALSRRQQQYGDSDARTAQAARDLGLFLCRTADAAAARRAMLNAVHLDERALGVSAPQTLEDVAALASVSPRTEAVPLLRRAAESPDPTVAGPALTTLAGMRKAAGDLASAATLFRRAVEKAEAAEGKNSPTVALILNLLIPLTPPKDAVALQQRALSIDQQTLGPRHPQTLKDVRQLAALLRATGRTSDAAALEQQFPVGK